MSVMRHQERPQEPGPRGDPPPLRWALGRGLPLLIAAGLAGSRVHAAGPALISPTVLINELQSSNGNTLRDEEGDSPDWFELWNPGPEPVNLAGWTVTDDADRPGRWVFPPERMPPGSFRLVYASGKDRYPPPASPVDPASVAGLSLWLSAETVDPEAEAQVRVAGEARFMRRWISRAGKTVAATQAELAAQPQWLADGGEGFPVLRFDGQDDQLNLPRPPGTNSFCLFLVCRPELPHQIDDPATSGVAGVTGQHYVLGAQHGGALGAGVGLSVGTNGVSVYEHGANYLPAVLVHGQPPPFGWFLVAVNYEDGVPTLDVNGLTVASGVRSPRDPVTAPVEIGRGAYGAFNGAVAELLMFDRSLPAAERRGLAVHFARRHDWSLPRPLHANFQLNAQGEMLLLQRPDGSVADQVTFGPVPRDVSLGRRVDGGPGWFYFAEPTPGQANTTPAAESWLAPPSFSHPGGFFPAPFDLVLTASDPAATIHYTLDGSEPGPNSPVYTGPLHLDDRAGTPNGISRIPTVPGGLAPAGEVYKGWVVRTRAFREGALTSPIATRTFWVHPRGVGRYSLPVVSLAVEPADFFDAERGIYVPGHAPRGNYSQRGPDWERPVHVEVYEVDGTPLLAQEGDVKIHGNTSQGFPIKGLDLDGTGGRGRRPFTARLFPDRARETFEHFLLRPTGHDQQLAFMRDELMQSLATETGAESQAARPCVVFINGEYWGLHYLKEKEDVEFVSFYGNVPPDELDYLEGYASAKAGDLAHYERLIGFLSDHDPRQPAVLAQVQAWMDVDNYIDYKAFEIFEYRWDIGNHRLWRARRPDGRWRWLQFDNDVGWGGFWAEQPAWEFDMLAADLTPDGSLHGHNTPTTTFLLRRLMENPDFRTRFITRFCDLLNTTLASPHTLARINSMAAALNREMPEHIARWRHPASFLEWRQNVEFLREFARRRPDACRTHLRRYFGLGEPVLLRLSIAPTGAGVARVNSLTLPAESTPWSGTYFAGLPISLAVQPAPGWRLARWEGLPGVTNQTARLELYGDLALRAVLAPDPDQSVRLTSVSGPDGGFRLHLSGPPRARGMLEQSADLRVWRDWQLVELDARGKALTPRLPAPGPTGSYYRWRLGPVPVR